MSYFICEHYFSSRRYVSRQTTGDNIIKKKNKRIVKKRVVYTPVPASSE